MAAILAGKDVKTGEIKHVLPGDMCFKLCDTYGIPFDVLQELLRERKLAFNWSEFCRSAVNAGWSPYRLQELLTAEGKKFEESPELFWAVVVVFAK